MRSSWYLEDIKGAKTLNKTPIIVLASASANRLKLLQQIGINPIVVPSNFAENLPKSLPPDHYVRDTAKFKALDVAKRLNDKGTMFDVIIGSDTIISFDGMILGKPQNKEDALYTLKKLNGQKHIVYTGVALISSKCDETEVFHSETVVEFGIIPEGLLQSYVNDGEPMGRAGSYAIQGQGAALVKSINGCVNNVIGLPIYEVVKRLRFILQK